MEHIKKISIIAMAAMVLFSFTNLFGVQIAGAAVILGVIAFFVNKILEKQPFANSGLDLKALGSNLKEPSIWFWLVLPIVMDAVSIALGKLVLPAYIDHVMARAQVFVSFDQSLFSVAQLAFLALGEEIAWRSFFQKQFMKVVPLVPALVLPSILFALGHFTSGDPAILTFDVFFVFVNSVLYSVIFYKTNNGWMSALSHFAANLFSVIILAWL